jgi:hypothetical protein
MTTPHPQRKARFYIILTTFNQNFITGKDPITFTLSTGASFPSDLSFLMDKTGRYLSTTQSLIEGKSEPKCEGDDCSCVSCQPDGCMNEYCLQKMSSAANVRCDKDTCERTNDMKYLMFPLYPSPEFYLEKYNPKFRFIRFIPSQKIDKHYFDEVVNNKSNTNGQDQDVKKRQLFEIPPGWSLAPGMTIPPGDFIPFMGTQPPDETLPPGWTVLPGMLIPPGETFPPDMMAQLGESDNVSNNQTKEPDQIQLPEFVVFSITYPSMRDFDTDDKFTELFQSIMLLSQGFLFFKEDRYIQHNIAVLQQILRINKLPKTLFNPKKLNLRPEHMLSPPPSAESDDEMVVIERYDETDLKDLSVPISSQEDTDPISDDLITPEPDEYVEEKLASDLSSLPSTTNAPYKTTKLPVLKKKKPSGLSMGVKIGIGVCIGIFIIYGLYYWKKKNQHPRR